MITHKKAFAYFTCTILLICCSTLIVIATATYEQQVPEDGEEIRAAMLVTSDGSVPGDDKPASGYADLSLVPRRCLGRFRVSFYCPCSRCCGKSDGITATGTQCVEGVTAAVDPSVIKLGMEFMTVIDGVEHIYCAEDTGGLIKGNRIDVYVTDHDEALRLGIKSAEVYVLEGEI